MRETVYCQYHFYKESVRGRSQPHKFCYNFGRVPAKICSGNRSCIKYRIKNLINFEPQLVCSHAWLMLLDTPIDAEFSVLSPGVGHGFVQNPKYTDLNIMLNKKCLQLHRYQNPDIGTRTPKHETSICS